MSVSEQRDQAAERIHEASLALLEDPGIGIDHEEVRSLLLKNGAKPGSSNASVRLPAAMVAGALAQCPKQFDLTDRRGVPTRLSAVSEPVFWSCPGMFLHRCGEYRLFTSRDMADMSRLLHYLDHVQAVFGMSLDDVPPPARDVAGLQIMAKNTTKHLRVLCFSPEGAEALTRMKPVVGKHPWFSVGFTAHGPLRWTRLALEIFRKTAGHGIPVSVNGEPMAGASGPATLAGAAAVGNAEILAGLVVNQLLEPGRPCIYNLGLAHIFDMRAAVAVTGGPENALLAQISARMGRRYDLPSASWVSTESLSPDGQAAIEKMFGFHSHMESGVNCIWGVGQLESELAISPEQAVIDNEMIGFALRYRRGFATSPDALAVEVTRGVGIAGSFLDQEHTAAHCRSEFFMPDLLFRGRRGTDAGGTDRLNKRAGEIAEAKMAKPPENGLSTDQVRALDDIAADFLRRVAG
jgi:trimethylamine--corrinoid protein Co-methyltransferase